MSGKKISMGARPTHKGTVPSADAWVEKRSTAVTPEPMRRMTIDLPDHLHRAIKSQCALRGTKMADEVRDLLMKKYGKQENMKSHEGGFEKA